MRWIPRTPPVEPPIPLGHGPSIAVGEPHPTAPPLDPESAEAAVPAVVPPSVPPEPLPPVVIQPAPRSVWHDRTWFLLLLAVGGLGAGALLTDHRELSLLAVGFLLGVGFHASWAR